jgi:hypothetical protein
MVPVCGMSKISGHLAGQPVVVWPLMKRHLTGQAMCGHETTEPPCAVGGSVLSKAGTYQPRSRHSSMCGFCSPKVKIALPMT